MNLTEEQYLLDQRIRALSTEVLNNPKQYRTHSQTLAFKAGVYAMQRKILENKNEFKLRGPTPIELS